MCSRFCCIENIEKNLSEIQAQGQSIQNRREGTIETYRLSLPFFDVALRELKGRKK